MEWGIGTEMWQHGERAHRVYGGGAGSIWGFIVITALLDEGDVGPALLGAVGYEIICDTVVQHACLDPRSDRQ